MVLSPRQAATAGGWVRCPRFVDGTLGISGVARGRLGANWEARLARVGGLALPLHDRALDHRRCGTGGAKRLHLRTSLGGGHEGKTSSVDSVFVQSIY